MMKNAFVIMAAFSAITLTGQEPLKINVERSAYNRWLNKEYWIQDPLTIWKVTLNGSPLREEPLRW
jgi:hypothetical protein